MGLRKGVGCAEFCSVRGGIVAIVLQALAAHGAALGGALPARARDNSGHEHIPRRPCCRLFDGLLQPERFKDYGPNGLQVEGKERDRRMVSGVTASKALIEAAIARRADAIFVHHGLFWRGRTAGSRAG
jgi:hypothetical protein